MSSPRPGQDAEAGKARHGPRSEVNWEGGSGRQPYENQEPVPGSPGAGEVAEGDLGELSGRNQEELRKVKGTP